MHSKGCVWHSWGSVYYVMWFLRGTWSLIFTPPQRALPLVCRQVEE